MPRQTLFRRARDCKNLREVLMARALERGPSRKWAGHPTTARSRPKNSRGSVASLTWVRSSSAPRPRFRLPCRGIEPSSKHRVEEEYGSLSDLSSVDHGSVSLGHRDVKLPRRRERGGQHRGGTPCVLGNVKVCSRRARSGRSIACHRVVHGRLDRRTLRGSSTGSAGSRFGQLATRACPARRWRATDADRALGVPPPPGFPSPSGQAAVAYDCYHF